MVKTTRARILVLVLSDHLNIQTQTFACKGAVTTLGRQLLYQWAPKGRSAPTRELSPHFALISLRQATFSGC